MITQYTKPQDTITLLLERVVQGVAKRSNPVVIAPQYLLSRRGSETLPAVAWTTPPTTITLSYDLDGTTTVLPSTYVTDIADVTLWADGVLLALDKTAARAWAPVTTDDNVLSTKLRVSSGVISGTGWDDNGSTGFARKLAVGDSLLCWDDFSSAVRRKITALVGTEHPASVATSGAGAYNVDDLAVAEVTEAGTVFSAVDFGGANTWSASYTGAKVGTGSGDIFSMTFTTVVSETSAVVTAVKASTGATLTGTAACTAHSGAEEWTITLVDGAATNTLVLDVTCATVLAEDATSVITVLSAYDHSAYDTIAATNATAYTGLTDTRVVIEVTKGSIVKTDPHEFRVSDTKGRGAPVLRAAANMNADLVLTGETAYLGLTVTLPDAAYRKGDIFYMDVTAAGESATVFNGVVLDGPAFDTGLNPSGTNLHARAVTPYTGQIESTWCSDWALASNVLTFGTVSFTSLALEGLEAVAGYGTISAGFRSIVPVPSSETWITIYDTSEIPAALGPIDMDNPIAYAASRAFGGTQGTPVYALRVAGLATADYASALIKISNTDMVYALTTAGAQTTEVMTLVKDHCESQSAPTKKNFRRVYLGVDSPGEYLRVGADSLGLTAKARILPHAGHNVLLSFSTDETDVDVDLVASGVVAGDIVKVYNGAVDDAGNATAVEYEILSLVEPESGAKTTQALLVEKVTPISLLDQNTIAEVWAADTADNQIDYLVAVAKSLGSRRAIVVWCENGTTLVNGATATVSSQYIAAEIAGLRCALLPQEGTTTYELTSVTSAPAMYTRYTEEQLNRAAANGVMVVCQEYPDGPVFIRHQLTTDTSNGLLAWEDSVGVNLDDQGFQVKDAFVGYRGRKNVTERTRKEIEDQLFQLVFNMTQTLVNQDIGPQITGFANEAGEVNKVTVKFHPIYKDRFITFYRPGMPVPLNGIDHTIFGEVQDVI